MNSKFKERLYLSLLKSILSSIRSNLEEKIFKVEKQEVRSLKNISLPLDREVYYMDNRPIIDLSDSEHSGYDEAMKRHKLNSAGNIVLR